MPRSGFDLFRQESGRKAALAHPDQAAEGDVIAYNRGYRSFAMAQAHRRQGKHFVFRIARNASPALDAVINDVAGEEDPPDMRTSFRNGLPPVGREIEVMLLQRSQFIAR